MICVLALIVFAVLAVFSVKYRPLAAEAFDCVFRRITFRKCTSRLDERLKAQIAGKVMRRHKKTGRFLFKYFEVFSWLLLVLLLLSLSQVVISAYNLMVYGNCNGLDEEGFCIFDPLAGGHDPEVSLCGSSGPSGDPLIAPSLLDVAGHPRVGSSSAPVTVIEFGCFSCPNTAEQAPAVKRLIEHFGKDMQFIYVDFPLETHPLAKESTAAAHCVHEQDEQAYWQYHFTLFREQDSLSLENLHAWAALHGIDEESFAACMEDSSTMMGVDDDIALAEGLGVYGTPTFFIDGEPVVGVKPYKFLKAKVNEALKANS
ncbi:DsbA family protein [Candidatus Woesearchaeota archaeon]|nr:DsbA family protein [Candidatus Woesearchaeota archaeon]